MDRYILESCPAGWMIVDTHIDDGETNALVTGFDSLPLAELVCYTLNVEYEKWLRAHREEMI